MGNCLVVRKGGGGDYSATLGGSDAYYIANNDNEVMYIVAHFGEAIKYNDTQYYYDGVISTTAVAGIQLRYYSLELSKNDYVGISVNSSYGSFGFVGNKDNIHFKTIVGTSLEQTVMNDRTLFIVGSANHSVSINGTAQSSIAIGTQYSYLQLRVYKLVLKKGDVLKASVSSGYGLAILYDGSETI